MQTLKPTPAQRLDNEKKRAAAKSQAEGHGTSLPPTWVDPSQLRGVMVFDTQSKQIVGNNCYLIGPTLDPEQTLKFDAVTAEFVGSPSATAAAD